MYKISWHYFSYANDGLCFINMKTHFSDIFQEINQVYWNIKLTVQYSTVQKQSNRWLMLILNTTYSIIKSIRKYTRQQIHLVFDSIATFENTAPLHFPERISKQCLHWCFLWTPFTRGLIGLWLRCVYLLMLISILTFQ